MAISRTISRRAAARFIRLTHGRIFSVVFVKRTTGESREMLARTGVKKHLKGGPAAYDFKEHGLVPVFDMHKEAYRSIPLEGITRLKVAGVWHEVA